jgi:hypothetical protein
MFDKPSFNVNEAHEYFSSEAYKMAWEYIKQEGNRSPDEELAMLHTAIASLWHWLQRNDVRAENLAAGYWQVSRVYNLLKQPENARMYGRLSLTYPEHVEPLFKAYAYETLAGAEMLAGNREMMAGYLEKAHQMTNLIKDEEDRQFILKDLNTIQ